MKGASRSLVTTPGRVLFNEALPFGFRYVDELIGKNALPIGVIVEEISARSVAKRSPSRSTPSSRWAFATPPSRV